MDSPNFLPNDPYLYRADEPHAGGARPISQGDVFVDVPLLRAATPSPRHEGQWVASVKCGPKARGMLVTHPCSSRSRATHALKESVAIAPVVRCPEGFAAPWDGYYEYFPLPALTGAQDYVADLSAVCPVRSEYLRDRRVACLNAAGTAALFHRLAMNSSRLDRVPDHFASEADRLHFEVSLWEMWITACGKENGFQEWLEGEFGGKQLEDASGDQVAGSAVPTGATRREALLWNYEEVEAELKGIT